MKYMGSKRRIANKILPIILEGRKDGQFYVEPFVGGGNMIEQVGGNRIGADSNCDAIKALTFIRDSYKIPRDNTEYTEKDYKSAASRSRIGAHLEPVDSYAMFAFSFGAKWCGGWSRSGNRDYVAESYRAAIKQKPLLQEVLLVCCRYDKLRVPERSIIYCDPPYLGATKYKGDFDHNEFWQWCRDKSKEGHRVFISEYNAPDDFECVWCQDLNVSVAKNGPHKKAIERLFVHKTMCDWPL